MRNICEENAERARILQQRIDGDGFDRIYQLIMDDDTLPNGVPLPCGIDIGMADAESAELYRTVDYFTLLAGQTCKNCHAQVFTFYKLANETFGCYNCYHALFPRYFTPPTEINLKFNF
jgi:hypothetical protein